MAEIKKARPPEVDQETRLYIPEIPHTTREISLVDTARHLYALGWNVFPVPNYWTREAYHKAKGEPDSWDPAKNKRPYIKALSYARISERARDYKNKRLLTFDDLFTEKTWYPIPRYGDNLAVMAGRTSGGLCIIDADQNGDKIEENLISNEIPYWDYHTGRGHNFIVRIAKGEAINLSPTGTPFQGVEVKGHNAYCVIPPSWHRLEGSQYQWGENNPMNGTQNLPAISIDELAWLGVTLRTDPNRYTDFKDVLPSWAILLAPANRKNLLEAMAGEVEEGHRNDRLTGPVYDLAAHVMLGHIDENEALDVLYRAADHCKPPYPNRQIDYMWRSAINKKGLIPSLRPDAGKPRGFEIYEQAAQFEHVYNWKGRTAKTDRAVFLVLTERAKLEGEPFTASCRNIAERAGIKAETASKALRRLQDQELITKEPRQENDTFSTPNRFRFTAKIENYLKRYNTIQGEYTVPIKIENSPYQILVFQRLGVVALHCYQYLLTHTEKTIAAIARGAKQKPSSCYRSMKRLKDLGLVSAAEGEWKAWELLPAEWQERAEYLGLIEIQQARKEQHQKEREERYFIKLIQRKEYWKKTIESYKEKTENA